MIEINGQFNTAICYTNELEDTAYAQIETVCNEEAFKESKIRIMPDVHAGKGCTIGTTMTIIDKVVPNMVGEDIVLVVLKASEWSERIDASGA